MMQSESMQSSVIWYRVPWGKSDSLRVFAGILLTVGVRASPIVFASSFVALERPTAILVLLGLIVGGVIIAGVMTVINLTAERSMTPLAIGIDDGHIHMDRSLWTYGVDVESIPVSDLRRLKIVKVPDRLRKKKRTWWQKLLRFEVNVDQTDVVIDYQDRRKKILFRPSGISAILAGREELVNALANLPDVTFSIEGKTVTREEWLATYTEMQKHIAMEESGLILKTQSLGMP
ncbi:MAG: hypothetical protein KA339_08495 [Candidatus Kapabacteria bacterium]|nr:hypothetical protein [Candidatus Kapabacteria bacterium]